MKILEWNVNCAIGSKRYGTQELLSLFPQKRDCDILILTEFYRLKDYDKFEKLIKDWDYEIFITPQQKGRNDVFIAVLEKYKPELQNSQIDRGMPEFLAVSLKSGDKDFVIVGVRFFGYYKDKYSQFINFLPLINCYENVIIGGDFNNAKIHGDENTIYTERQIDSLYSYCEDGFVKKYRQFNYNYHRIKLWFTQNKFSLNTPIDGFSHPYKPQFTGGSKIDHFATKGIQISNVEYLPTELSDHYQLVGEITV